MGKYVRNMLSAGAQFENDQLGERTQGGMLACLMDGRWPWRPPFGYRPNRDEEGKPKPLQNEKAWIVLKCFELMATGLYKQKDIAKELLNDGVKISHQLISKMLRNPFYKGIIEHHWLEGPVIGKHQGIISEHLFFQVQERLKGNKPLAVPKSRNNPDFPLRRYIMCHHCENPISGSFSKGNTTRRAYYHCSKCTKKEGKGNRIPKDIFEEEYYKLLKRITPDPKIIKLFETIVKDTWKRKQKNRVLLRSKLISDLENLEAREDYVRNLVVIKEWEGDDLKKEKVVINKKRQRYTEQLLELDELDNDMGKCVDYCTKFMSNIADLWKDSELDLKQRFQKLVFPRDLSYANKTFFGTSKLNLVFKMLSTGGKKESLLVAPGRIELPLPG
ncbi:hypothetical protein DID80_01605 [Candidatus Marinamargulisbacteria bacterium SCGC AAA071-K20]|nr:hypothetical protein DID80_01605 [Candidatus Marinamargulisbacteria bacterium SCGC AAA071-K20]